MKKIVIFGAGNCGKLIAKNILRNQDSLLFFIDNDVQKHNTHLELDGGGAYEIKPPQEILKYEFDTVVLGTFTGLDELKDQLTQMGVSNEKIDSSYIESSVKARIAFLEDFAEIALEKNLSGNVAELGVYRGDFARFINARFPNKKLYLFDTFEGFSQKDIALEGNFSSSQSKHFSNTSIELVLEKMPHRQNCIIKKGWFPQSAKDVEDDFCFVNLDADLYMPILEGLNFFYPKMVQGGVILIHEYFSKGYKGVKKAYEDFSADKNIISLPIGDNLSLAIIKT